MLKAVMILNQVVSISSSAPNSQLRFSLHLFAQNVMNRRLRMTQKQELLNIASLRINLTDEATMQIVKQPSPDDS